MNKGGNTRLEPRPFYKGRGFFYAHEPIWYIVAKATWAQHGE